MKFGLFELPNISGWARKGSHLQCLILLSLDEKELGHLQCYVKRRQSFYAGQNQINGTTCSNSLVCGYTMKPAYIGRCPWHFLFLCRITHNDNI